MTGVHHAALLVFRNHRRPLRFPARTRLPRPWAQEFPEASRRFQPFSAALRWQPARAAVCDITADVEPLW